MKEMERIEELARKYSEANALLQGAVRSLDKAFKAAHDKYDIAIHSHARRLLAVRRKLINAVKENPALFKRPKTVAFDGVKVGYRKQKGTTTWRDEDTVVALIHKLFPDLASALIRVEEKPNRDALGRLLKGEDLKKLSVEITRDSDVPVVALVDSEAERIVKTELGLLEAMEGKEG